MMKLPKFEEPNPSSRWLRAESSRLKNQADKMLAQTKILELFAKFGKVSDIGGSYLYDLMIYPDLDLGIINDLVDDKTLSSLVSELIKDKNVRSINLVDTYHFGHLKKGRPDGYWLGLEMPFDNDRWGIDCWIQQPEWVTDANDLYKIKLNELGQKEKDAILNLKYQLIYRGLYGKKYHSNDIYDAVIKRGPLTIEEFLSLDAK